MKKNNKKNLPWQKYVFKVESLQLKARTWGVEYVEVVVGGEDGQEEQLPLLCWPLLCSAGTLSCLLQMMAMMAMMVRIALYGMILD